MGLALERNGPDDDEWSVREGHSSSWAVKKSFLDQQSNEELKDVLASLEKKFAELAAELGEIRSPDGASTPSRSLIDIHRALSRHVINIRKIEDELRARDIHYDSSFMVE